MRLRALLSHCLPCIATLFLCHFAAAATYPEQKEGDWTVTDFRFHTGETLPQLKLHYTTLGAPTGEPVIIMHGTAQSSAAVLAPGFAGASTVLASRWMRVAITLSCRT